MKCIAAMICGNNSGTFSFLNVTYQFKNEIPTKEIEWKESNIYGVS